MGNISSANKKDDTFDDFYHIIDYIATYYILTMDFKSLSKLTEKEYCDKLVVLTADVIDRYFNDLQVDFLAQRIKDGVDVNEMSTEKVKIINKEHLDGYDISNDAQKSIKKKRVCIGIAKFYIKIAHIFSAIVMTINPVYTYKDATGATVKASLMEKDKIPKGTDRKLFKLNICDNRIRALKQGEQYDENTGDVSMQPKICDINMTKNGTEKTLEDEPGIPELMRLYFDDNYDYSNGRFTGMSSQTEKQFRKDLALFYTAFTGNDKLPDEVKKFSDIKLRNYGKKQGCQQPDYQFKNKYVINKKDELFVKYANNTKKMIQTAASNQQKLLECINDIFTFVIDPYTKKRVIRVNPKLTDELLQQVVEKTRRYVINLYVTCEKDYAEGVKLFEAIVETKIIETTQKQISRLKTESDNIIMETSSNPIINQNIEQKYDKIPVQNIEQKYDKIPVQNIEQKLEQKLNQNIEQKYDKIPVQNIEQKLNQNIEQKYDQTPVQNIEQKYDQNLNQNRVIFAQPPPKNT